MHHAGWAPRAHRCSNAEGPGTIHVAGPSRSQTMLSSGADHRYWCLITPQFTMRDVGSGAAVFSST